VTDRVKLGTSVFVVPYRDPVTLAAEIAALDVLSDGRFIFGAGIGWMREEFAAIGIPPDERGARTDEHLEAMKVLWTEDPASFDGKYTKFENVVLATQPRTEGGPPIWIGGNTDAALRRVVRLGEAWHGFEVFVDEIPGIRERIAAHAEEAGRDPEEIELTVARGLIPPGREEESFIPERRMLGGSGEAVVDELGRYAEAGVGMVLIQISLLSPHVPDALEWVASEVLAKVG
jgi:probable F420-dependent oxidoreductase